MNFADSQDDFNTLRSLVKLVIEGSHHDQWTLQGLGMFRLYLSETDRLHVWNEEFSFPGASTIHDHPWDFDSLIIAGRLWNRLYKLPSKEGEPDFYSNNRMPFRHAIIKCGTGGSLVGEEGLPVELWECSPSGYFPGDRYSQNAEEVHETHTLPGTVTIVRRRFRKDRDRDHANVFWRKGEWGSAEPRQATENEVKTMKVSALEMLERKWS
jgi:hypothetical protein